MPNRQIACLVAALLVPALASAQSCLGSVAPTVDNTQFAYAGGTLDLVANSNAIGGRLGRARRTSGRTTNVYVGARSISGGAKSILAVDLGIAVDLTRRDSHSLCAFAGIDAINLSDADNGYVNLPFGVALSKSIASGSGTVTFLPFGAVAGNLASTGDSELGDFSMWIEGGFGFRLANGITLTPSLRQSFQTGADPVIRFLAMVPFGAAKPMK